MSRPYSLHPAPCTHLPAPYTLHPTPYTLHLTPFSLHPTPCTLHPTPYTLHHKQVSPYLSRRGDRSGVELLSWYHRQVLLSPSIHLSLSPSLLLSLSPSIPLSLSLSHTHIHTRTLSHVQLQRCISLTCDLFLSPIALPLSLTQHLTRSLSPSGGWGRGQKV